MSTIAATMAPTTSPDTDGDHLDTAELQAGISEVRSSPRTEGRVEMLVARPDEDHREVQQHGRLTTADGLVGDGWRERDEGTPDVAAQLTLMNARFLDLISQGDRSRWPWAGDQLIVDLDLGTDNLQPGDRLRVGDAVVEVTSKPHTGCRKFVARYGVDAQRFVNTEVGMELRLRGIYVRVVEPGEIAPGDTVRKVPT